MCEAKRVHQNNRGCRKTVALRYQFVFDSAAGRLHFEAHKVRSLPPTVSAKVEPAEHEPEFVEDFSYLKSLDPKEWKSQDHYRVLGLARLRHRASDEAIRNAYRKMVLKHHPDKRKAQGESVRTDDDYFTCITMAYETLGTTLRRRAYDSVDPQFDNEVPSNAEVRKDFYGVCGKYFGLNARWSERSNVPDIGTSDSSRDHVDRFYSFWYDFKSWREYSYEDEEDKEKCQDRDERRYVDKMNKAERIRKKKEEMQRIRHLVDIAYNNDPRIQKFKQEDKDRKLAIKRSKQTAAQAKKEEEERILREAQQAREMAEAAERARIEAKRRERGIQIKLLRKERKTFRDYCQENEYYCDNESERLDRVIGVERVCFLFSVTELEQLNSKFRSGDGRVAFFDALADSLKRQKELDEKNNPQCVPEKKVATEAGSNGDSSQPIVNGAVKNSLKEPKWNENTVQLLVKAVNLFPAGTNQRWEVVANFINQHAAGATPNAFNAKMVLAKAKDLQSSDFGSNSGRNNLKEVAQKHQAQTMDQLGRKEKRAVNLKDCIDESQISQKYDDAVKLTNGDVKATVAIPWTTDEQQLLEQALKTYPSTTAERWDRIAECIPNRSKRDCMRRYKELVETVKAKKAAQAALQPTVAAQNAPNTNKH